MENVKHIKNITVENFKCFDYLQVDDFSKYNIILGNNNVGKTSFLEALLFDENATQTLSNFQGVLYFKKLVSENDFSLLNNFNPFNLFLNRNKKDDFIFIKYDFLEKKGFQAKYETIKTEVLDEESRNSLPSHFNNSIIDKEIFKITTDNLVQYRKFDKTQNYESFNDFVPYLYSAAYYGIDLIQFYTENFTESKEKKKLLISQLKSFIPDISDIELTYGVIGNNPIIGVWLENNDSLLSLPFFGDGTVRLFRIIMEITVSKDRYLCVDEIDTGIHFSNFKRFIKVIISTANKNNVQLFITTHNNEFLKAFKEVLEEDDFKNYQNETKCFSLKKLPKGNIKAYPYNFDEFEFAIEQENELR